MHFFIEPDTGSTQGNYTLQLNKVQKIEIIERNKQRTADSHVTGAIGYTLGAVAFLAFIVSDAIK
ncbi:MAG: hypothetical protein ABIT07_13445 [Ferruginibacter sp.]